MEEIPLVGPLPLRAHKRNLQGGRSSRVVKRAVRRWAFAAFLAATALSAGLLATRDAWQPYTAEPAAPDLAVRVTSSATRDLAPQLRVFEGDFLVHERPMPARAGEPADVTFVDLSQAVHRVQLEWSVGRARQTEEVRVSMGNCAGAERVEFRISGEPAPNRFDRFENVGIMIGC